MIPPDNSIDDLLLHTVECMGPIWYIYSIWILALLICTLGCLFDRSIKLIALINMPITNTTSVYVELLILNFAVYSNTRIEKMFIFEARQQIS